MKPREGDPLSRKLEEAIATLEAWADANPYGADPTELIDDTAEIWGDDEQMVVQIQNRLWIEWARIQADRELIDEFEDDLD